MKKWLSTLLAPLVIAGLVLARPSIVAPSVSPPFTLDSVYVNTIPSGAIVYGAGALPARPFTVQAIRFHVRTAGSGGSTNDTFRVSDGTNTCNCSYACNQSTGAKRATCADGAGVGCAFPSSAALTYSYSAIGDCTTDTDVNGNISIEGVWP